VEFAGGAIDHVYLMGGLALPESGHDLVHGVFQVSRGRDGYFPGMDRGRRQQAGYGQQQSE
jgi:predicted metal-binding protein